MASFSDLLRGVDRRVGYHASDPDRVDNNVDWSIFITASPKKTVDLTFGKKVESEYSQGKERKVDKMASKLSIDHGDCTTSYGFTNDKLSCSGKGKVIDDDNNRVDIAGAAWSKPAKR